MKRAEGNLYGDDASWNRREQKSFHCGVNGILMTGALEATPLRFTTTLCLWWNRTNVYRDRGNVKVNTDKELSLQIRKQAFETFEDGPQLKVSGKFWSNFFYLTRFIYYIIAACTRCCLRFCENRLKAIVDWLHV